MSKEKIVGAARKLWLQGALVALAAQACVGYASARESGFINPDLKWPSMPIRTCWDGHEMTELGPNNTIIRRDISVEQGLVEQAVANTWEYYGAVKFDWGYVKGSGCDIIINLQYDIEHTVKHGKELRDYVIATQGLLPNMTLDFSLEPMNLKENYPNWSTLTADRKAALRKMWIQHSGIHEFGHALGFYHEHKRTDKDIVGSNDPNGGPNDKEVITSSVMATGYYDKYSIMNYYALSRTPGDINTTLSCGDVAAIRSLYGSNTSHDYLAQCCTVEKITQLGKTPDWPDKYTSLNCPQPSTSSSGGINGSTTAVPPVHTGNSLRISNGVPVPDAPVGSDPVVYANDVGMPFGWEISKESQNDIPGYRISMYVKPGFTISEWGHITITPGRFWWSLPFGETPIPVPDFTGGEPVPGYPDERRTSADGSLVSRTSVWIPKGAGTFDGTTGEFYKAFDALPAGTSWWNYKKAGAAFQVEWNFKAFSIDGIANGPFDGSLPYEPFDLARFTPFDNSSLATSLVNIHSQKQDGVLKILPFKMAQTELTQMNYWLVMGKDPTGRYPSNNPLKPADGMRYYEAVLFCNRLSEIEGLDTAYSYSGAYFENASTHNVGAYTGLCKKLVDLQVDTSKTGYRLPTPEEWAWAMKAGASTKYYWGDGDMWTSNQFLPYEWGLSSAYPAGVSEPQVGGQKLPNRWRLYDMVGNLKEFVWVAGAQSAHIGGSYFSNDDALRTELSSYTSTDQGFRIIRKGRDIPPLAPLLHLLLY